MVCIYFTTISLLTCTFNISAYEALVVASVHLGVDFSATTKCMQHGIYKCLTSWMLIYSGSMISLMTCTLISRTHLPPHFIFQLLISHVRFASCDFESTANFKLRLYACQAHYSGSQRTGQRFTLEAGLAQLFATSTHGHCFIALPQAVSSNPLSKTFIQCSSNGEGFMCPPQHNLCSIFPYHCFHIMVADIFSIASRPICHHI